MKFLEAVRLALSSLWSNRLRSFLTVIGNVVAVLSVVVVVSVIQGLDRFVAKEIKTTGADVFCFTKIGFVMDYEEFMRQLKRPDLRLDQAEQIAPLLRQSEVVVPRLDRELSVRYASRSARSVRIAGVGAGYDRVADLPLAAGRHLGELEIEGREAVAVVGDGIREKLFLNEDPLGRSIRLGRQRYRVIGVIEKRGGTMDESRDDQIFVPISALRRQAGGRGSIDIYVKAAAGASLEEAQEEASLQLKIARGLDPWDEPDFALVTDEQAYQLYESASRGIYGLLVGVVSLSLLIGGIVIMNIMLVAVTERTREIGIRKAIGARRQDIVAQFLVEAVVLAFFGGLLGVGLGVVGALLVAKLTPLPASVQLWSVLVGLLLASSVGLFFGIYPAHRASRLAPIEALRAEG
ncbi:MAG: ABC transporter permease [Candidatus Eisenbacteria bacterium]|nr:ABC transporter permease [Candidatus Eisenbacteria bacterium]MCC7141819.1 ABC transporter permease [Candidatus Eisenbacteria bacterium]